MASKQQLISAALFSKQVIYTVIFSRIISAISDVQVANNVDLGIDVAYGNALWLMWGAAAAIIFAVLPFSIACASLSQDLLLRRADLNPVYQVALDAPTRVSPGSRPLQYDIISRPRTLM